MNDDEFARLAAVYRRHRRPSPERRARIEAAVFRPTRGSVSVSQRRRTTTLGVLGIVSMVAALVLVWVALAFGERQTLFDAETMDRHEAPYTAGSNPATGHPIHAETDLLPPTPAASSRSDGGAHEGSPSVAAPSSQARPRSEPPLRPTPRETTRQPETQPASDRPATPALDIESLQLLRAAERELSTDPQRSLIHLRHHATRYPRTPLALERDALMILALCEVGDRAAGLQRKAAFLSEHTNSLYDIRVRAACSVPHE